MAGTTGFTSQKVARWLRAYRDWKAECTEEPGAPSCTDYSRPVVMGGLGGGDPAMRSAERNVELEHRCLTVERWLAGLSRLERIAASYWLDDEDGTITAVALEAGLQYKRARDLVTCIPLIIWARHYDTCPEVDD